MFFFFYLPTGYLLTGVVRENIRLIWYGVITVYKLTWPRETISEHNGVYKCCFNVHAGHAWLNT